MIIVDLVVDGGIIGLPLAVASYYAAVHVVMLARRRLELRKALRMAKRAGRLKNSKLAVYVVRPVSAQLDN